MRMQSRRTGTGQKGGGDRSTTSRYPHLTGASVLCLLLASASLAQSNSRSASESSATASDAVPKLEIIDLKWKREARLPRNFDPSIIPTDGAFNDPATRGSRNTAPGDGDGGSTFPATPSRLPVFYVYSLKLKNVGATEVAGVAWDYIFVDPNLNAEVGRHQFLSYEEISAQKTATLRSELRSPPIRAIGATTGKHSNYKETAIIQCVLYADDTMWKNPKAKDGVCEFLRQNRLVLRQKHNSTHHDD